MNDFGTEDGAASAVRPARPARRGAAAASRWDMAVIGAGPAGSACAYSALEACPDMRVALVDRDTFPRDKACGDAVREEAAVTLGDEFGLGALFDERPPVLHRIVTTSPQFAHLKNFLKGKRLVYIVEREVLDHSLFKAAAGRGAADFTGHKLTGASFDERSGDWAVTLRKASGATAEIRCGTLVGADGAGSRVRRIAGLDRSADRHTSVALRGYARASGLPARTMRFDFIESLAPGYGWTFPLRDGRVNVGVIIDKAGYKRAGQSLKSYLDEYLRMLRGEGVEITGLEGFMAHPLPLGSELPPLVPKPGVALIGDAGSMIHPLTGEGIHFAIWGGRRLGTNVGQCVQRGTCVQAGLESFAEAYAQRFSRTMKGVGLLCDQIRFRKLIM